MAINISVAQWDPETLNCAILVLLPKDYFNLLLNCTGCTACNGSTLRHTDNGLRKTWALNFNNKTTWGRRHCLLYIFGIELLVEALTSTSLMTHNKGSKASQRSHTDVTDHRWLTAEVWPQSPPGLSGFCRGNTGSSKGRHSEAQRVASHSPWTWGAPQWPACEQTPWKRCQTVRNIFAWRDERSITEVLVVLPRWIWRGVDWCKIILVDLRAPDDLWYRVDGLKGKKEILNRNLSRHNHRDTVNSSAKMYFNKLSYCS